MFPLLQWDNQINKHFYERDFLCAQQNLATSVLGQRINKNILPTILQGENYAILKSFGLNRLIFFHFITTGK